MLHLKCHSQRKRRGDPQQQPDSKHFQRHFYQRNVGPFLPLLLLLLLLVLCLCPLCPVQPGPPVVVVPAKVPAEIVAHHGPYRVPGVLGRVLCFGLDGLDLFHKGLIAKSGKLLCGLRDLVCVGAGEVCNVYFPPK